MLEKLGLLASGSLLKGANSALQGAQNYYLSRKQAKLNWEYTQKNAALQYQYAQRYTQNSPTWQAKGLRDAGFNPILAVSNGANFSASAPTVPTSNQSAPSVKTEALMNLHELKELELLQAEIDGQKIRNENDSKNRGLGGQWGALSRLISEASELPKKYGDDLQSFISNKVKPLFTIEKTADYNEESYSDDERKAHKLYDILQMKGFTDSDIRDAIGEEGWDHLENYWSKFRRNTRGSKR